MKRILLFGALFSPVAWANNIEAKDTILGPALNLISGISHVGNLLNLFFVLAGMYSLIKLVAWFKDAGKEERGGEKNYKKPLLYFLGVALGLNALVSSQIGQRLLTEKDTDQVFDANRAFSVFESPDDR